MTRASCPSCRLRFTPAATPTVSTCPECGRPLQASASAETTLGYQLFPPVDHAPAAARRLEIALPLPADRT